MGQFDSSALAEAVRVLGKAYADASRWDQAMAIAEEFGAADLIIEVLENALDTVLSDGRVATAERWLALARQARPLAPVVHLAEIEIAFRTGNAVVAREAASRLVRTTPVDDPLASRIYLRAGQISHLDDRVEEAVELFTAAEALAKTPLDVRRALWNRFISLTDLDDREGATEALHALESRPPLGVDDLLRASQARLQYALRWGGVTDALAVAGGALSIVGRSKDPVVRTGFLQSYGIALTLAARYGEARDIAKREIEEAQELAIGTSRQRSRR
jgi:tetratricopeptide (TPR) repeat protein